MLLNIVMMVGLVALIVLFGWLAIRAWRARNLFVRIIGGILTSLLTLALVAVTAVAALGFYRLNVAPYAYTVADIQVQASPELLARGEKAAVLCSDCHAAAPGKLPLEGGPENMLAGGPPFGELWAPNLTPGGPLKDWSDGEIIRAIREGVDQHGRPLMIMPSKAFRYLSDQDVEALVAYLRSQPAVDRRQPERNLSILGALLVGSNMFPTSAQTPVTAAIAHPQPNTAEYGLYLVDAYGCRDCHGVNLQGGSGGFGGEGPALAGVIANWSAEGFAKVFHEGVDPTGHKLGDGMPWKAYGNLFTEQELNDLYTYLKSVPLATQANAQ